MVAARAHFCALGSDPAAGAVSHLCALGSDPGMQIQLQVGVVVSALVAETPNNPMRFLVTLISIVALNDVPPATPDPVTVELKTFQFAPDTLRVGVGTTVRWTNKDDIEHTVTAGSPSERDTAFNATLAKKGTRAEKKFDRTGTFTYFCDRHQFMRGTITVTR